MDRGQRVASSVVVGAAGGHRLAPQLTLEIARFVSRSDLTLTVQGADAPNGPWTNLAQSTGGNAFAPLQAGVLVSESGTGDQRAVTVSDLYPITDPAHPRRFMRLRVDR